MRSPIPSIVQQARILWSGYGHARSAKSKACLDGAGQPIPWYTYPAIEYIKQLDLSDSDVFEFGAGYSTLFWSARARSVIAVEDEEKWSDILRPKLPTNCTLHLETDISEYPTVIERYSTGFDIVVVDGPTRGLTRLKCCRTAVSRLRRGGMIILDNSDWLPMSAAFLRDHGLIEVDFTGFIPLAGHTQTTSLFLDREFAFRPVGVQPRPGPGAVPKNFEPPVPDEGPFVECDGEVFAAVRRDEIVEIDAKPAPRHFRLITTRALADRPAWAAIIDVDLGRVLLSIKEPTPGIATSVEQEIARVRGLTWEEFRTFIRDHPKRRYIP